MWTIGLFDFTLCELPSGGVQAWGVLFQRCAKPMLYEGRRTDQLTYHRKRNATIDLDGFAVGPRHGRVVLRVA